MSASLRRVVPLARREDDREICEAGIEVYEPEAGHRAAHEIVGENTSQRRPRQREVIVVPEWRPREDDKQQADLEEEGDVDQTTNHPILASAPFPAYRCGPTKPWTR